MASTPTTKSQVQAYRFVLRRMESALVRKDAVMLHDPMGSHKRATVAGAVLAAVGIIGFLVWGLFGGKGTVPEPGNIVVAKESGSVFVVTSDDKAQKRLIPMLNMASAKLLVMQQGGKQGSGAVPTTTVKEAALADFARGPLTGMVNAPTYVPSADNPAEPSWAVCDVGQVQGNLSSSRVEAATKVETTVIGGDGHHGVELAPDQSLFVKDQSSGDEYLVYRAQRKNEPNTHAVKAKVGKSETVVRDVFGLNGVTPRTISTNMLNAIPTVPDLQVPEIPNEGATASYLNRYKVGDVVKRSVPGEPEQYFLLLQDGKQTLTAQGAAAVLHAGKSTSREVPNLTGAITTADESDNPLNLDHFPMSVPKPVSFQQNDTSCLSWKNVGGSQIITMTLNKGTPAVKPAVKLAQFDGSGPKVDYYYGAAGKAAVVRGTSNEAGAESGPIFLVSDQGVQYGIKDLATAQGLGVAKGAGDLKAGPSWLMRTLPRGDFLDPAAASATYDSVPVGPGVNRPAPKPQAGGAAGG
ncbi:type VII secretion protein EccB [Saccharopolyspora dendranthemae]|uniref:Type VII secretion protein EccB n=1 Tax=Saccharopolyspora dendranthemae TaxID=1181886 RepID=A0A561U147_9PSEU|nr:type VII secretion protein EccB [Saccharopolyspora dendranthemae]TWF93092.1 type VII secretion protein EccB [Saccharopolyspora dendranthemae]